VRIAVRPARLDQDAAFMVEAVRRHLNPAADEARFEWLYRRNPDGEARAWIAEDAATGSPIGMAAAFPRGIHFRGRGGRGWVLGDFCVADSYRTLGPALQLQRACLAGLAATGAVLLYDLPGAGMGPVYRRLGIAPSGHLRRLAKPLRVDGRIPGALPAVVAGMLRRAGNDALALRDACRVIDRGLEIGVEDGPCGPEYSDLAARLGARHGLCVHRSADYISWRFLAAPHRRYRLLAARRRGALAGYVVLDREGDVGWIVDLVGADETPVIRSLVLAAVERFRHEGLATAALTVLDGHPWITHLAGLGFRSREARPVIVCTGEGRALIPGDGDGKPWLLVQGDRES